MPSKWKLVLVLRIAPHTAMPTAPPRLRIMLNRPLAYLRRSGARLPRPRLTAGATAKTCGKPRKICGRRSWSPPQSWVMKLKLHMPRPNEARPNIISRKDGGGLLIEPDQDDRWFTVLAG